MNSRLAYFDEARYRPADRFSVEYCQRLDEGYERLRNSRVVIAGLARNVEWILPWTSARIDYLSSLCKRAEVLIYENDSSDQTVAMLQRWSNQRRRRIHLISESHDDPVHPPKRCLDRAERMAHYRSVCQAEILHRFSDFDYVILIDTDLIGGFSYDGIAHTMGYNTWDFVGSNGIIYKRLGLSLNCVAHYDAWAYREDQEFTPLSARYINRLNFKRGEPMIPLYSCFGGMGIYRMQAFQAGEYDGKDTEHVGFHRSMRQKGFGQQFLNPSQIAVYGRKHRRADRRVDRFLSLAKSAGMFQGTHWLYAETVDPTPAMLPSQGIDSTEDRAASGTAVKTEQQKAA